MVVAELVELELLVAAVAERSRAVSRAEVPMEYWVRDEKMGVDCNSMPTPAQDRRIASDWGNLG